MSNATSFNITGTNMPLNIKDIKEVKLLEKLGVGGTATVWKVCDTNSGKEYVLKEIQLATIDPIFIKRIESEASVSIASDYVIPVIGIKQWDDHTFLLLFEYFPSKPLDIIIAEGLSDQQKLDIFQQILTGVSDAHYYNIIHRDLKPANILVNSKYQLKIIDFGISKFKTKDITIEGHFMGTIPYVAPEILIQGSKIADARTDIYSLGHIFYELIIGTHFWTKKKWDLGNFAEYLNQDPTPNEAIDLTDFSWDFFPKAKLIISRMVKTNIDDRYSSVNEIISDLGHLPKIPTIPKTITIESPILIVESGTNQNSLTPINIRDQERIILGRADFAGADTSISREHLEFLRQDNNYYVRDLGSKNKTLLRGKILDQNFHLIQDCDRLKVGEVFLRFVFL